jgi:hypothetical protein
MGIMLKLFVVMQMPNDNQTPKQYLHESSLYKKELGYLNNNQSEYENPLLEL